MPELMTTIGMLVLMFLVFIGAYWASRFLAQRYHSGTAGCKNMRILERMPLGKDSWLIMVQVCDHICLLGATGKEIRLIDRFDVSELTEQPAAGLGMSPAFSDILKKIREKGSGGHE